MKQNQKFKKYYNFRTDLEDHPDAWLYIIVGGRNTGKTYSALRYYYEIGTPNIFIKRINDDIDLLCSGNALGKKAAEYELDLSPYKPINRDLGTAIKAFKIRKGLGGYYSTNEEGSAAGSPIAYIASLHAVSKIKGFDMTEAEAMIFDEFIPEPWERIDRKEGEQLMELYKTVSRDRILRGRGELKLICLANAVAIWNPTLETLGLVDKVADMAMRKQEVFYDEYKRIFIRILETPEEMIEAEKDTGLYRTMHDTDWGRVAYSNEFAYNDFTNVRKVALKGYRILCEIDYKRKKYYIYTNEEGFYYMTHSRQDTTRKYNLDQEMSSEAFYYDVAIDMFNAAIDGRAAFETYSMYDMIINFKRRFVIR